jgi:(R,R)-butanediol dehydrogenase/meso-butanediol dehydrogenase/diacetyl reductase
LRPALLLTAPDTFSVDRLEDVPASGGLVGVEIAYTGLCGTDLHIVEGLHPRARFPLALGHELVGRVEGGPEDGQLVVVDPLISCGTCSACRLGHPHVCANLRLIGIDSHGGLAGRVLASPERLHPVPSGVDPRMAALAEPLAVAVHAVRRAPVTGGSTVVVAGAGPIGLLLALVVRRAGAARVLVMEPSVPRRTFAERCGFELLDPADPVADLRRRTDNWMADVVLDAAAVPAVAAILPRLVHPAGAISLVGVYSAPAPVDLQALVFGELTVIGNRVYAPADIDTALDIIAGGELDLAAFVTEIVGLRDAPAALRRLRAGEGIKYLVDCRAGA